MRRVAQIEWNIIEEQVDKPFVASGLKFIPLPVSCSNFSYLWQISSHYVLALIAYVLIEGDAWRRLYILGISLW